MSEVKFSCPGCAQHLECDDAYSGDEINCPHCQAPIIVSQRLELSVATEAATPSNQIESEEVCASAEPPAIAETRRPSKMIWMIAGGLVGLAIGGVGVLVLFNVLFHRPVTNGDRGLKPVQTTRGPDAVEILRRVAEFYKGLDTFTAVDHQETVVDAANVDVDKLAAVRGISRNSGVVPKLSRQAQSVTMDCDLELAKPGFYRITWVQAVGANVLQRGAVWSWGQGDFVYQWPANSYFKAADKGAALAVVPGFMGVVVNAFFGLPASRIYNLESPTRIKDEPRDGRECYVLSGTMDGDRVILWVAKVDFQVVQIKMVTGGLMVSLNDEELAHSIQSSGKKVTPETMAAMREAVEAMSAVKGSFTESYQHCQANQPTGERAFIFDLPAGATYLTEKR